MVGLEVMNKTMRGCLLAIMIVVGSLLPIQAAEEGLQKKSEGTVEAARVAKEKAATLREHGFVLRSDLWTGVAREGGQVGVRHHLFKVNEYVFTLGVGETAKIA